MSCSGIFFGEKKEKKRKEPRADMRGVSAVSLSGEGSPVLPT